MLVGFHFRHAVVDGIAHGTQDRELDGQPLHGTSPQLSPWLCPGHGPSHVGGPCPADGARNLARVNLEFRGEIWYWRGPAPHHFITVPEEQSVELEAASPSRELRLGNVYPATVRIGKTEWQDVAVPQGRWLHRAGQGGRATGRSVSNWVMSSTCG